MEKKKEETRETEEEENVSIEETEIAEAEVGEDAEEIGEKAAEEVDEGEAPLRRKEEEEFVEEKIFTIALRRAWMMPPRKRAPKAIRIIKAFVQRHMKVGKATAEERSEEKEGGRIIISNEVNEKIWSRGIEKPPRNLRIRAAKDEEDNVTIFLA